MGPFVDADHPAVVSGALARGEPPITVKSLWDAVADLIEHALAEKPQLARMHVVLLPAWNDANCMPVLPQPPLPERLAAAFVAPGIREVRAPRRRAALQRKRARARSPIAPPPHTPFPRHATRSACTWWPTRRRS